MSWFDSLLVFVEFHFLTNTSFIFYIAFNPSISTSLSSWNIHIKIRHTGCSPASISAAIGGTFWSWGAGASFPTCSLQDIISQFPELATIAWKIPKIQDFSSPVSTQTLKLCRLFFWQSSRGWRWKWNGWQLTCTPHLRSRGFYQRQWRRRSNRSFEAAIFWEWLRDCWQL